MNTIITPFSGWAAKYLLVGPLLPFPKGVAHAGQLPREIRREMQVFAKGGRLALAAAWQQHEKFLRGEASRLGIKPRWPGGRFFSEAMAATCAPTEARR